MDVIPFNRNYLIFEGILFLFLGILAVVLPGIFTLAFELVIGWLFLIGGGVQAFRTLQNRHATGFWPSLISALLYIIIGVLLIAYPLSGILSLTILLAIFFLVEGIAKLILGFQLRPSPNWGWLIVSGLISIAMAAIIWGGWPFTAIWVIGLLIGINLVFAGISLLFWAWGTPKKTSP